MITAKMATRVIVASLPAEAALTNTIKIFP
jgi:hypothetical protein